MFSYGVFFGRTSLNLLLDVRPIHSITLFVVAWVVNCRLVCVRDCDLLLDVCDGLRVMVSWLPCCCMGCDLLLDVCHGLCIIVSCCVVAWVVMLFA